MAKRLRAEDVKVRSFVIYPDGREVELCKIPEDERREIMTMLNERALRTIGYVPVKD